MSSVLISPTDLADRIGDDDIAVVDCRFVLADPGAGRAAYLSAHIAGAVYAHLDDDLCGPIHPGVTGRHPLPDPSTFAATLGRLGIDERVTVVAYDDAGGALAAARLWWMLRWVGHPRAFVLDGGWAGWNRMQGRVTEGVEGRRQRSFTPRLHPGLVVDAPLVAQVSTAPDWRVLDARTAERFRGENETIDPVAGRIPGAVSAPFAGNLRPDGRFLSPDELRARFAPLIGDVPPGRVVCYCGSGVTAAQNVLALEHAGFAGARLYAGSWSEWITDPSRPVASG